ncbi:MAG: nucleoside monophosphate kinase [Armatimonadetes bacterium]|nr:nucleoside monophosphate kinase [Armatimonadota bacterium]
MPATTRYKTFLLFGAPGSGKGTQGKILGSIPGLVHVACGEIFRDLRVGSPLGKVFLDYSSRGALVPDDFTIQLWKEHTEGLEQLGRFDPATDALILDGIPRNVAQARLMDEYVDVKRVYYLDCEDKEKMFLRLKRRALHENRLDDASDAVIQHRLYVYEAETAQVLSYYPVDIIRRINTDRTPVEVLADILADIRDLAIDVEKETTDEA